MIHARFGRVLSAALLAAVALRAASPVFASPGSQQRTPAGILENITAALANPNVAYLLLVLGLLSILAEVVTAGTVLPGVVGVICLLLSSYGLLHLPTNWIGLALIVSGLVMFVVDIKVAGWVLSIGALVAFALGSLMIFTPFWAASSSAQDARLNPWLIVGTTGGVAAFFFLGLSAAIKAQFRPVAVGSETLLGQTGRVLQRLAPAGIIHLAGEEWSAESASGSDIEMGASVRVIGVEGLTLRVEPAETSEHQ